jgi:hypothetical protein
MHFLKPVLPVQSLRVHHVVVRKVKLKVMRPSVMCRPWILRLAVCAIFVCCVAIGHAKDKKAPQNDPSAAVDETLKLMMPLKDAATNDQIREYLQWSRVVEDYKAAWIAGVDKNRARSQQYLPDSYWTDLKTEIQDTDLSPAFSVWFKHTVSNDLMDKVLDAYLKLGKNFPGSPMCVELGKAQAPEGDQWNRLTVLLARQVIAKVNAADKTKIDEARAKYAADHPGWREGAQ